MGKLVVVIISIAILSFVFMDLTSSGSSLFGGGNIVGEINGHEVTR